MKFTLRSKYKQKFGFIKRVEELWVVVIPQQPTIPLFALTKG